MLLLGLWLGRNARSLQRSFFRQPPRPGTLSIVSDSVVVVGNRVFVFPPQKDPRHLSLDVATDSSLINNVCDLMRFREVYTQIFIRNLPHKIYCAGKTGLASTHAVAHLLC